MIEGNIWGNIKKAVRSWRWWSDRVVNSNVKDLAVLPPLKLAFYTFIICEQTTLWLIGPNSDKFMTKWTFISQQRDPKWHIHSNGQLAWMDFPYLYFKMGKCGDSEKICWTFYNAIERYSERWQKSPIKCFKSSKYLHRIYTFWMRR